MATQSIKGDSPSKTSPSNASSTPTWWAIRRKDRWKFNDGHTWLTAFHSQSRRRVRSCDELHCYYCSACWQEHRPLFLRTEHRSHAENMALGKQYKLWPAPNYPYCTDPDDIIQLTDGKTTKDYFWTQKGTVGWVNAPYVTITVDLGKDEPIDGVAFDTAAGVAGVEWPVGIDILVSSDGKVYRHAGELVALDQKLNGPWPKGYAIRRLVTHELQTHGRYVQFLVIASRAVRFLRRSGSLPRPTLAIGSDFRPTGHGCQAVRPGTEAGVGHPPPL